MGHSDSAMRIQQLCENVQIGQVISEPQLIEGGLLHKLYAVQTSQQKFAIKELNAQIMLRPTALNNFINSEKIASYAKFHIPAIAAIEVSGTQIHKVDHCYYVIFNWSDGISLKANQIDARHCEKMGAIVADLHRIDFSHLAIKNESTAVASVTDWSNYVRLGQTHNSVWHGLLYEHIDQLYHYSKLATDAAQQLSSNMLISHRDLEPKNVLWEQGNPIIIDWESAGYCNAKLDLIETAMYWATTSSGNIDKERLIAFITAYSSRYGAIEGNWEVVLYNGLLSKLDWLEYNLKRSLFIECTDEQEQQLGTTQVLLTINAIIDYASNIPDLIKWIDEAC